MNNEEALMKSLIDDLILQSIDDQFLESEIDKTISDIIPDNYTKYYLYKYTKCINSGFVINPQIAVQVRGQYYEYMLTYTSALLFKLRTYINDNKLKRSIKFATILIDRIFEYINTVNINPTIDHIRNLKINVSYIIYYLKNNINTKSFPQYEYVCNYLQIFCRVIC